MKLTAVEAVGLGDPADVEAGLLEAETLAADSLKPPA